MALPEGCIRVIRPVVVGAVVGIELVVNSFGTAGRRLRVILPVSLGVILTERLGSPASKVLSANGLRVVGVGMTSLRTGRLSSNELRPLEVKLTLAGLLAVGIELVEGNANC